MVVVKTPENPPAAANPATPRGSFLSVFNALKIFLPISNPAKLRAKMGAVPIKGAPIPEIMTRLISLQFTHIFKRPWLRQGAS